MPGKETIGAFKAVLEREAYSRLLQPQRWTRQGLRSGVKVMQVLLAPTVTRFAMLASMAY
jgi:hypothetical protein